MRKRTVVVLSIIGSVSVLAILTCAGVIISIGMGMAGDLKAVQASADSFLDQIRAGQIDEAYASTAPAFKAKGDSKQLKEAVDRYPALSRATGRTMTDKRIYLRPDGRRAFIQYNLASPEKTLSVMLVLVESGGRWKVESVNLQ